MSIFEAIEQNNIDAINQYLAKGGNVNVVDKGQTPLMRACKRNRLEIVNLLLKHKDIDITLDNGYPPYRTAFYYAIEKDNKGSHQQIIDALYQTRKLSERDHNLALIYYAKIDDQLKVKECLDNYHCNINYTEMDIGTPLMQASANGHLQMVKLLLSYPKIDINKVDDFNDTALIIAARLGCMEVVRYLLEQPSINLHIQSYLYGTALTAAIWAEQYEVAKILLKKEEKNFNDENHPGALLCAVKNDAVEMVQLLLETKGADINSDGSKGYKLPPAWVFEEGYASPFASKGPPVFDLPLNYVIKNERLEMLSVLLKHGAKLDVPGAYGKTAQSLLENDFGKKISDKIKTIIRDSQNILPINKINEERIVLNQSQLVAQNGMFKNNAEQRKGDIKPINNNKKLVSTCYYIVNLVDTTEDKKSEILKFLAERGILVEQVDEENMPEELRYRYQAQVVE